MLFYSAAIVATVSNYYLSGEDLISHSVVTTTVCVMYSIILLKQLFDIKNAYSKEEMSINLSFATFTYLAIPIYLIGAFFSTGKYESNNTASSEVKTAQDTTIALMLAIIVPTIAHTYFLIKYPMKSIVNIASNSDEELTYRKQLAERVDLLLAKIESKRKQDDIELDLPSGTIYGMGIKMFQNKRSVAIWKEIMLEIYKTSLLKIQLLTMLLLFNYYTLGIYHDIRRA